MQSAFSLDDRSRLLRWLAQGSRLAREKRGDRARPADVVWLLMQNAVQVMDKTPDQEKRWLTSGYRSGGWNQVGLTFQEARELERLRAHAAIATVGDSPDRIMLAHEQDRSYDVLSFLRWCGVHVKTKRAAQMRKAAVILARQGDCDAFRKVWLEGSREAMSRQAVSKFRQVLCGHILAGLREDCGIYPVPGTCEFI